MKKIQSIYKNLAYQSYLPGITAIFALLVLGQILRPGFASSGNISSILNMASVLSIVCIGQLVVIVGTGGIDLSTGANVSMGALIGSLLLFGKFVYLPAAVIGTLVIGGITGLINGIGVRYFKIPALAMTLFMATIIDGFTMAVTKGKPSLNLPILFKEIIGKPIIGKFCPIILIAFSIIVLTEIVLRKTIFGKSIYMLGSNIRAAGLCGLRVSIIYVLVYVISGAMSCLAGLILVGYVGSGQMNMGNTYTMLSVAAVVIGGTKVTGGKGTLIGGVLGSIVLMLLSSVLISMGMPEGARQFVQGVILLTVLVINCRLPKFRQ